jgi:hypothetical protein
MKKNFLFLAITVVVVVSFWLHEQWQIDSCLDAGRKWNYLKEACDMQSAFVLAPAPIPATVTGCVTIPATGLTWELKTDDGGIHDKDNTYRWGGTGAQQTGSLFYDDWNALLDTANSERLCGFDDWRVPTIDELKTLVTANSAAPLIDTSRFALTLAEPYWSVSTYAQYPEHAHTVDFGTGTSSYYQGFRGNQLPVRLVRDGKTLP